MAQREPDNPEEDQSENTCKPCASCRQNLTAENVSQTEPDAEEQRESDERAERIASMFGTRSSSSENDEEEDTKSESSYEGAEQE